MREVARTRPVVDGANDARCPAPDAVGRGAVPLVQCLRGSEVSDVDADQDRLEPASGCAHAEVDAARFRVGQRPLAREEAVLDVEARRREDANTAQEELVNLVPGSPG